jgi:hypothetical protein
MSQQHMLNPPDAAPPFPLKDAAPSLLSHPSKPNAASVQDIYADDSPRKWQMATKCKTVELRDAYPTGVVL